MSADNWAVCPECYNKAAEAHAVLVKRLAEGYGVLPLDEFDALRATIASGVDEDTFRTFREDYETYMVTPGIVRWTYHGGCEKCGTECSANYERQFWTGDAAQPESGEDPRMMGLRPAHD